MSSVSDQLQRNFGKSHNAAVRGDKEMCGLEEKRGQTDSERRKARRDSEIEGNERNDTRGGGRGGRHSGTLSAAAEGSL